MTKKSVRLIVPAAGLMVATVFIMIHFAQANELREEAQEGGGPPQESCRSDIDEDGVVGVGDLLHLFADWGPCPWPNVVAMVTADFAQPSDPFRLYRLRSNGLIDQNLRDEKENGWSGWEPLPGGLPPAPANTRAVALAYVKAGDNGAPWIFVMWSDGSVVTNNRDCPADPPTWCGWELARPPG